MMTVLGPTWHAPAARALAVPRPGPGGDSDRRAVTAPWHPLRHNLVSQRRLETDSQAAAAARSVMCQWTDRPRSDDETSLSLLSLAAAGPLSQPAASRPEPPPGWADSAGGPGARGVGLGDGHSLESDRGPPARGQNSENPPNSIRYLPNSVRYLFSVYKSRCCSQGCRCADSEKPKFKIQTLKLKKKFSGHSATMINRCSPFSTQSLQLCPEISDFLDLMILLFSAFGPK